MDFFFQRLERKRRNGPDILYKLPLNRSSRNSSPGETFQFCKVVE
jgi:hypothetical protein